MNPYKYQSLNILTPSGRIKRAQSYIDNFRDAYIVFAKYSSWNIDDIPPLEYDFSIRLLPETIVYKKVFSIEIIEENLCSIKNNIHIFDSYIQTDNIKKTKVLIKTKLYREDLNGNSFRMIGLHTNLISNRVNSDSIFEEDILYHGNLEWFSISTPLDLFEELYREINIVLQF
ncbi:hypothetical protein V6O07_23215 [Arthrospira platensis SPKY2]